MYFGFRTGTEIETETEVAVKSYSKSECGRAVSTA